jgi:hypothetical protein
VLCEYDVSLPGSNQATSDDGERKSGSDFAGFLMNPCVVRDTNGELRLLGFPNLVGFGERVCSGGIAQQNARTFLLGTEFENLSGLKMVNVFSAIKAAWTDDDGLVRKHVRLTTKTPQQIYPQAAHTAEGITTTEGTTGPIPVEEADEDWEDDELDEELDDENLDEEFDADAAESLDENPDHALSSDLLLKEKRVKVGENVCAFGIYSGEKRGLVPGGLGADRFIKLVRGKPETIEAAARNRVLQNILGGIMGLTIVHAAAWALLQAAPK